MKNILRQTVDDARLYRQLLDKLDSNTNTGESNLTADEFYGYIKSLNNPKMYLHKLMIIFMST